MFLLESQILIKVPIINEPFLAEVAQIISSKIPKIKLARNKTVICGLEGEENLLEDLETALKKL